MHPSSRPSQTSLTRLRVLMVIAMILSALPLITSTSRTALAAADTFDLGNGHDGALSVASANTIINTYLRVTAPIAPDDTSIVVASTTGITAGDLVMVLQTTGIVPE